MIVCEIFTSNSMFPYSTTYMDILVWLVKELYYSMLYEKDLCVV